MEDRTSERQLEAIAGGAMEARANRVANGLASIGVQHGDRVLVMLPNSEEGYFYFVDRI